jgi:hypothetical protein
MFPNAKKNTHVGPITLLSLAIDSTRPGTSFVSLYEDNMLPFFQRSLYILFHFAKGKTTANKSSIRICTLMVPTRAHAQGTSKGRLILGEKKYWVE